MKEIGCACMLVWVGEWLGVCVRVCVCVLCVCINVDSYMCVP